MAGTACLGSNSRSFSREEAGCSLTPTYQLPAPNRCTQLLPEVVLLNCRGSSIMSCNCSIAVLTHARENYISWTMMCLISYTERGVQWENETIVGGIISQQPCQPKWLLWCCEEGFYVRRGVCYSDHCLLQVLALGLLQLYFLGQLLLSNIVNMYCNRLDLLIISDLYNSCLTTFLQPLILFSVCAYRIE